MDIKRWDKEEFIKNCELLCKRLGINQKEFNERVYRDALTKWKRKKEPVTPSLDVINKVVDAFEVDICWLLTGRDYCSSESETVEPETEEEVKLLTEARMLISDLRAMLNEARAEINYYRGKAREPEDEDLGLNGPMESGETT